MTTNLESRSWEGWLPSRFLWQDGQPVVEWLQLGQRRFVEPFFAHTVQFARAGGCPVRLTPADALAEFADAPPDLPLGGFIFHLSRCGSTLVSRMLGALPANVVVSEPEALADALRTPGINDTTRLRWLRGLVHAYGARRFPEEQRLFLKLDPWLVLDVDLVRAAFPGTPCVYVYRDPVEILVSLSDDLAITFAPTSLGAERLGLTDAEAFSLSSEEYCARTLGRLAAAAAGAAGADPAAWRLVNYAQLPRAVETVVAPHFGLTPEASEQEARRQVASFHAKASGKLAFQPDSARKQRDADQELRELAARWVGPAYGALESLRGGRQPAL